MIFVIQPRTMPLDMQKFLPVHLDYPETLCYNKNGKISYRE